ncbi:unnamed protein product [Darwinula stevensoni]|uniref:Uncharacterized protein n=1 Tax=Darwinula stevensoni TaxID=69355 RepID=A0A7R8XB15_9CRUS|nr:unnamed protein product [Darwinula stevensoni]CAG0891152.1 unnamed protein product [Darwinula stevensoni]
MLSKSYIALALGSADKELPREGPHLEFMLCGIKFILTKTLRQFLLIESDVVRELPEGVFGNVTFEALIIFQVAAVHPSALLPSKDRLYHVQIYFSGLAEFPWEVLPELTHLYYMDLKNNYLTDLPPVLSPNLTTLDLGGNQITRVEYNWSAPNLTVLSIGFTVNASIRLSGNQISELTEASIRPMLEVFSSGDGYIDLAVVTCRCCGDIDSVVRGSRPQRPVGDGEEMLDA